MPKFTVCENLVKRAQVDNYLLYGVLGLFLADEEYYLCIDSHHLILDRYKLLLNDDDAGGLLQWLRSLQVLESKKCLSFNIGRSKTKGLHLYKSVACSTDEKMLVVEKKEDYKRISLKDCNIVFIDRELCKDYFYKPHGSLPDVEDV